MADALANEEGCEPGRVGVLDGAVMRRVDLNNNHIAECSERLPDKENCRRCDALARRVVGLKITTESLEKKKRQLETTVGNLWIEVSALREALERMLRTNDSIKEACRDNECKLERMLQTNDSIKEACRDNETKLAGLAGEVSVNLHRASSEQEESARIERAVIDHDRVLKDQEEQLKDLDRRLESQEEGPRFSGDIVWKITNYAEKKATGACIFSPPFYTHPFGYKLCLRCYPHGIEAGESSHLSLFIHVMKGELDKTLQWPLRGQVTLEIKNLKNMRGIRFTNTFATNPASDPLIWKCPTSKMNPGKGSQRFAAHKILETTEHLVNDALFVVAKFEPWFF